MKKEAQNQPWFKCCPIRWLQIGLPLAKLSETNAPKTAEAGLPINRAMRRRLFPETGLRKVRYAETPVLLNSNELDVTAKEEPDISLREMLKLMDQSTKREVENLDREILSLVRNLGGNASSYRRERGRAIRAGISEIYSPPRVSAVAKMCPSFGSSRASPSISPPMIPMDDTGIAMRKRCVSGHGPT